MKDNRLIKYPLTLGIVALIAGLLLALVYNFTNPIIEKNANKRENAAILEVFGEDAKIENISEGLINDEKSKGVDNAYIVDKEYYVYKLTIKDGVGSDNSSAILALKDGKIYTFKLISAGDSYAGVYNSKGFIEGIKNKDNLSDTDIVSGTTMTGEYVIESINAAIAHYGRVK